ncbi:MAG: response regulator [Opitutae bacterium]|nr:response regulator [Opitutae bacterium]
MTPLLRTLEEWTIHLDYVWFVVVLAWSGVLYAAVRLFRSEANREGRWATALVAAAGMAGGVVEIAFGVFSQGEVFRGWDSALGLTGCLGIFGLALLGDSATPPPAGAEAKAGASRRKFIRRALLLAGLLACEGVRVFWRPVEGGLLLGLIAGVVALLGVRRLARRQLFPQMGTRERTLLTLGLGALLAALVLAPWGPLAYLAREGRRDLEMSHFALPAALCQLAAAALWCRGWVWYGLQLLPKESPLGAAAVRSELRIAVWALMAWVVAGLGLTLWLSRWAMQRFETQLLRRVETAAALIDAEPLAEALGPQLKLLPFETVYQPAGWAVQLAAVTFPRLEPYEQLRAQLRAVQAVNSDALYTQILTLREGWLIAPMTASQPKRYAYKALVHRRALPEDYAALANRRADLSRPDVNPWGNTVTVRAPLYDPQTRRAIGWLALVFRARAWSASYADTRLQILSLVALGVGFWVVAFAHRLRSLERTHALHRAEQEAQANRAKSAFLSKVSHELRTPLQALLGFAELLTTAGLEEPHGSRAAALRAQGALLLRLVNDLLDLGALQTGVFRLSLGPTELCRVVAESVQPLRPRAESRGLALESRVDPALPAWIESDGMRLQQVIFNLVGNAIKYTERGSIRVELRPYVWPGGLPGMELRVTDTGPGIPRAKQAEIFKPYARLSEHAEIEGLGLGLALAQSIGSALGGVLSVESDGRHGATFLARWPIKPCAEPAAQSATAPVASLAGLRVLVADDNTVVRELLAAFLVEQGCLIETACDGVAALTKAKTGAFEVVLLDLSMPEMEGCAVASELRRTEPPGRHTLVVGLSAHAQASEQARALAAGMDEFFRKPVVLAQLAAYLGRLRFATAIAPAAWHMPAKLRQQLCAHFAAEWPALAQALQTAQAQQDWALLRSRAHYLKNSADVLGAEELQTLCRQLEEAAEARALTETARLLGAIDRKGAQLAKVARFGVDISPLAEEVGRQP